MPASIPSPIERFISRYLNSGQGASQINNKHFNNEVFQVSTSGVVAAGNANIFHGAKLQDGDTLEIYRATLAEKDFQPLPAGVDLVIATFDGSGGTTRQSITLSADGGTTFASEETSDDSPLDSYTNNSGGVEYVGILVDNGNYNAGTSNDQSVLTGVNGLVV